VLKASAEFQTSTLKVRVSGVGFFEASRSQTGSAANGLELHPVLRLEFAPTGSPAPLVSDADRLFDWAEVVYPGLFSRPGTAGQYLQYTYRYYPSTGNYLAVADGRVIVHNGRDWNFLEVGAVGDFLPLAARAGY
jgi:hypothetical protein